MSDQPSTTDVHVNTPIGTQKPKPQGRFLAKLYERLKARLAGGAMDRTAFDEDVRHARAHAGGTARAEAQQQAAETNVDLMPCPTCGEDIPPDSTVCPFCDAAIEPDTNDAPAQATEPHLLHDGWRLFLELRSFAEPPAWIPYLPKPGTYTHPRYGELVITPARNARFVAQFNQGVYQSRIPLDAEHETKLSGATGWITALRQNSDGSADAQVEWTDRGRALIAADRFRYISPEWYDEWQDPASGKAYQDVAIGGALTTRPFFKDGALRPLVATERGIEVPTHQQETPMADETPAAQFTELQTQLKQTNERLSATEAVNAELKQTNERLATESKAAAEKIAAMETTAQERRFSALISGDTRKGESSFIGDSATHLTTLRTLAQAFGEDNAAFTGYVTQQRAIAAQVQASGLFQSFGGDGAGATPSALTRLEDAARKLASEKGVTYEQAFTQVCDTNRQLYNEYRAETRRSA